MTETSPSHHGIDLAMLNLDHFEESLVPILRHFLTAIDEPKTQAWHLAYATAAEKWGSSVGLAVAHDLAEFVRAALACHPEGYAYHDPLELDHRRLLTADEAMLIMSLHYMRRDQTDRARVTLENATRGRRDARMIRAALSFAHRHGTGANARRDGMAERPALTLVS